MNRFKYWILYSLYLLVACVVFLYLLFPGENAKAYIENRINGVNPQLDVDIDRVKPALPLGLDCMDIRANYNSAPLFRVDRIALYPGLTSFLGSSGNYSFKGEVYQGKLDGRVAITKGGDAPQTQIDTNIKNLRLEEVEYIENRYGTTISGKASGKIKYKETDAGNSTTALVTISQGSIQLPPIVPVIKAIDFTQIKAVVTAANRQVRIKSLALTGPQINGTLSGTIQLRRKLGNSKLSLRGKIKPDAAFLADLKEQLPPVGFLQKQPPKGGYKLSVTGTINKPKFSIN